MNDTIQYCEAVIDFSGYGPSAHYHPGSPGYMCQHEGKYVVEVDDVPVRLCGKHKNAFDNRSIRVYDPNGAKANGATKIIRQDQ